MKYADFKADRYTVFSKYLLFLTFYPFTYILHSLNIIGLPRSAVFIMLHLKEILFEQQIFFSSVQE